jgi:hypothetical protein
MDGDLNSLIKNENQEILDENIQYFLSQILIGLKYLHSAVNKKKIKIGCTP